MPLQTPIAHEDQAHDRMKRVSLSQRFKRLQPTPEQLASNRWLRWLGPRLFHQRMWHASRRGIALGAAIGVFFGFLIPLAQIPVSAAVAVALRANLPIAVVGTLVTNPVTSPPVYYAAWIVGGKVGVEPPPSDTAAGPHAAPAAGGSQAAVEAAVDEAGPLQRAWSFVVGVGRPLVVGLAIFALGFGLLAYALVSLVWLLRVRLKRRGRVKKRLVVEGKS
jgi:uncharacterized protein